MIKPLLNYQNELLSQGVSIGGIFNHPFLLTDIRQPYNNESVEKMLLTSVDYSSTYIHERMHWNQFAGTSFGNLILYAKFAQGNFLNNVCHRQGFNNIRKSLDKVEIKKDYTVNSTNLSKNELQTGIVIQNLIDKELAIRLFSDGVEKLLNIPELSTIIATTLSDIHLETEDFLEEKKRNQLVNLDEFYDFGNIKFYSTFGYRLSVKELFEGQARASEMLYLLNVKKLFTDFQLDKSFNDYFYKYLKDNVYWKAFKTYLKLAKREKMSYSRFGEDLTRFCLLVDIALSPQTIMNSTIEDLANQKFDDFYPCNRFIQACVASTQYEKPVNIYNSKSTINFTTLICKLIKWKTPEELSISYLEKYHKKIEQFSSEWESNFVSFDQATLSHYLHYIFYKFSEIRTKNANYISNLGLVHTGSYIEKNIDLLLGTERYFISSPLYCSTELDLVSTFLKEQKQFQWVVSRVVSNEIYKSIFLGQNDLTDKVPFKMPENLQNALVSHFSNIHSIEIKL